MAYQLTAEVLDHSPRDLTLGERSVLLVIAEGARVEHRTYTVSRAELADRSGLSASGLRSVLRRLRDRGLDVRVPSGRVGADGRPIYAVPGSVVTYRLPVLRPVDGAVVDGPDPAAVDNSPPDPDKGGTACPPAIHKGGTECAQGGHEVAARGARDVPPPRSRGPVDAPAPARDVPARKAPNPPPPVDVPPLCPEHSDVAPGERPPPCRDCAELRRAWSSRRSQQNRDELRRRNRCRACDELGWLLDRDGLPVEPAVRCRHSAVAQRVATHAPTTTPTTTSTNRQNAHA